MNYRLLFVFFIVALMVISPTVVGIIFDGQALENSNDIVFDKSDLPEVTVELYITSTGEIRQMKLDEYVSGVLLAEVPSFYEKEAVKALAVAVRSYCMRRIKTDEKEMAHYSADMCDDYSHCLGYISLQDASALWGPVRVLADAVRVDPLIVAVVLAVPVLLALLLAVVLYDPKKKH